MFDISHAPLSDRQAPLPHRLALTSNTRSSWLSHVNRLQSQKDLGFVLNPGEGPISAVALYVPAGAAAPTHMFSGGAEGTLAVWSAGRTWDCLKVTPSPLFSLSCCQGCVSPWRPAEASKCKLLLLRHVTRLTVGGHVMCDTCGQTRIYNISSHGIPHDT